MKTRFTNFVKSIDVVLLISLIIAFLFCVYGINWGRVEEWNPDQMAFRNYEYALNNRNSFSYLNYIYFSPGWFQKPPFHGYFNYFLSYLPLFLVEKLFRFPENQLTFGSVGLIWSRLLTCFLFLSSIFLTFQITKRFFGLFSARLITLLFATSAGLIAYSHFLTTDIPVMFWMLFAFYFSQNIYLKRRLSDYMLSGFLAGIATATKYNALFMVVSIIMAHILSFDTFAWSKILFSRKLFLSLLMVIFGFLVANPFSILDYHTFISGFWYNYTVTPIYDGTTEGNSYLKFFLGFSELIGMPSLIFFSTAFLMSVYFSLFSKNKNEYFKPILLLLSVLSIYYYKIGSFPRLETRFILPVTPYFLMLAAPFLQEISKSGKLYKQLIFMVLMIIVGYNTICSLYVGKQFLSDPRMAAQNWVKDNVPPLSSIETGHLSPHFNLLPGVNR